MEIIRFTEKGAENRFQQWLSRHRETPLEVEARVDEIIHAVRKDGDRALVRLTRELDGVQIEPSEFQVPDAEFEKAMKSVSRAFHHAVRIAGANIRKFHKRERQGSWRMERHGASLGQRVLPLGKVGIYVPGGKAAYPSTVLMSAIPAKLAGVPFVAVVTPPSRNGIDPHLLVAAREAGVHAVYRMGGAQAIAALAYGTETIPKVDKIVGPGNAYVATAKKRLFGVVDIDSLAGPSEIAILADDSARPEDIGWDLIAQMEHDEEACAMLITPSEKLAAKVSSFIEDRLKRIHRSEIVRKAYESHAAFFIVESIGHGVEIANGIGPEHLEILTPNAANLLDKIVNAGCVFIGPYTPVAVGDYTAGPNHVLPTRGTSRFRSSLGVYDFVKRINYVQYTLEQLETEYSILEALASVEGFPNHAASVRARLRK